MVVYYPAAVPTFGAPRIDGTSVVVAVDVNALYDEVVQIASTLDTNPQTRATAWSLSDTFDTTTNKTTVRERITNVENGTYIVYNDYVKKSGGTIILPTVGGSAATNVVNLTLTAQPSQTANLLEVKVGGVVKTSVDSVGRLRTTTIDGGTA